MDLEILLNTDPDQLPRLPSEDQIKSALMTKLKSGEINREQVEEAVNKYKADVDKFGLPLSDEKNAEVETYIADQREKYESDMVRAQGQERADEYFSGLRKKSLITALFEQNNPVEAETIATVNPYEAFMIGMGEGAKRIKAGLTGEKIPQEDQRQVEALKKMSPYGALTSIGGVMGETAPFIAPGMAAGKIASVPLRAAASGLTGATEGYAIARGNEQAGGQGAMVGGTVASAMELAVPYIGRLGGSLYRKLTGNAPQSPLVNPDGSLSADFTRVLDDNGLTPDDFLGDVQNVVAMEGNDQLSDAVNVTAGAIKSGGRDLKAVAAQPDIDPEILRAATRLGIADELPISAMSKNQQFIELEQGLTSIIGSQTSKRQVNAIKLMKEKADEIITQAGGTTTDASGLSVRIASELETTRYGLQKQAEDVYNTISSKVPPQLAIADMTPLQTYLREQLSVVGMQADELSPIDKRLKSLLGSETKPKLVTYGMIDRERKKIGEQLSKISTPYPDATEAELSKAYETLTELQGSALSEVDPDLIGVWDQGKQLVSKRKELEESIVKSFGKGGEKAIIPTLESGVTSVVSVKGLDNFKKAIDIIPEEMRGEAVATALNRVFTKGSNQSQLNMGGFVDWFDRLNRNQTSKDEIFKHLSEESQGRLEDLYQVSKGFRNALLNKKDTGRVATLFDNYDKPNGLLNKLYSGGGVDPQTGAVSAVIKSVMADKEPLSIAADRLLASSPFKRLVVVASQDPQSGMALASLQAVERSKEYNKWVSELPANAKSTLISVGLIPWLLSDEEQEQ
jgi:hypothetical protein